MTELFEQMPLKEAKQTIKEWLEEIHLIENKFLIKLFFEDNYLKADQLIAEIKDLEKRFKRSPSIGERISTNRCNHEEKSILAFIQDKQTMLMKIEIFVGLFNELEEELRVIIYDTFFKKKLNILTAQKLNVSLNKLERIKSEGVSNFAEMLISEQFLYQLDV